MVSADVARYRLGTRLYSLRRFSLAAPLLAEAYRLAPALAQQQPAMALIVAESLRIVGKDRASRDLIRAITAQLEEVTQDSEQKVDPLDAPAFAFALIRRVISHGKMVTARRRSACTLGRSRTFLRPRVAISPEYAWSRSRARSRRRTFRQRSIGASRAP